MSRILHQTLMDYLDITEPDTKHKDIIVKHLENDITREIINENIEEIQIREKQAFKETILKEKLQSAKEVAIIAIIVGFFVGLLVNQITEIIAWGKSQMGEFAGVFTGISSIVILLLIFAAYKYWFVDKISNILNEDKDKNNE